MTSSLLYCPTCGAANASGEKACFACNQDLTLALAANQPPGLLHQRYEMLAQVGAGGFGAVYKARDIQDRSRLVAVKQINLRGLTPQEIIDATDGFNREVQILSRLSHAHLPRIHTHFTDPDHWYVVMDFIEGETLEHYLRDISSTQEQTIRKLPVDEILDIGLQLCDVLAYLHACQPPIIFRDLKPSNLIRTRTGQLYLIDFGIARYFKPGQTRDTSPLGSPGYAAPEQYGRAQTDGRADIYSLGALLYSLLSRRDPSGLLFSLPPLRIVGSPELNELTVLVMSMVEVDVERRPTTIVEVQQRLRQIQGRQRAELRIWRPSPGQTPPQPGSQQALQIQQQIRQPAASARAVASRKGSRRKLLVGGLTVVGVLSLGGFSYWKYWHPSRLFLETGYPRQIGTATGAVSTLALSPGGQQVAFGLNDGSILTEELNKNSDLPTGLTLRSQANKQPLPWNVLAWSPDYTQLLATFQAGEFQLWNVFPQQESTIQNGGGDIKAAAWSPNGQRVAVVDDQTGLRVYDVQTGHVLLNDDSRSGKYAVDWSPDGSQIATIGSSVSAGMANVLQIWDVGSESGSTLIPLNSLPVTALAWSPDGNSIAVMSVDGLLQVWHSQSSDQNQNGLIFSQRIDTQQAQLAWSPDNHFLATIDDFNQLLVLDRSNGNTLISTPIADKSGRGGVFLGKALAWPDSEHITVVNNQMECWLWSLSWF